MALRAGYKGIKKYVADMLNKMNPGDSFATDAEVAAAVEAAVNGVTDLMEDTVGWIGKNLLPPSYSDGDSKSQNGVAFTKNNDGTVTVTIAESATGTAYYYMYLTLEDFIERGEKYIINDFLNNDNITFSCNDKVNNVWGNTVNSNGLDVEWTPRAEATAYGIWIIVSSGTTSGTYIVKPMISKDSGAYEPYHASVSDRLAEKVDISALGTQEGATASKLYHVGEHFYKDGQSCEVIGSGDVAQGATWTLNTNYKVKSVYDSLLKKGTFSGTTTAGGSLTVDSEATHKVLAVYSDNDTYLCFPYVYQDKTLVSVKSRVDLSAAATTSISGFYYYVG